MRLPRKAKWLLALGILGLASRFVLSGLSRGSNDAGIWEVFGENISRLGLTFAYVNIDGTGGVPIFNHPPIPALVIAWGFKLAQLSGIRFAIFLKLPGLIAEVLSGVLIWKIWSGARGPVAASIAFAAFAWSLCSILVSGYHGNTDCAYAFLCLLAVYLIETKDQYFLGGLALAGAINVKLTPVILLPAIAATLKDRRQLLQVTAGLALGVIPFIPFIISIPHEFLRNVVAYTPIPDQWGLQAWLIAFKNNPRFAHYGLSASDFYLSNYRFFLFLPVIAIAVYGRMRKWDLYRTAVCSLCLFLVVTPGFGVQYTALICPLLFAVSVRWGLAWSTLAGLCIGVAYMTFFDHGSSPWSSTFSAPLPMPAPFFGILAWGVLIQFITLVLMGRLKPPVAELPAAEKA